MSKRRLQKELQWIKEEKIEFFREIDSTNPFRWKGLLLPTVAPYNKGAFRLEIIFPEEYPFRPPAITFITKIYHPNVNENGNLDMPEICFHAGNWSPSIRVVDIIHAILNILNKPDEHFLRHELFSEFKNNPAVFYRNAEEFTKKFAEKRPLELSEGKSFLGDTPKVPENAEEQSKTFTKKILPDQPEGKCAAFVEDSPNTTGVPQSAEEIVNQLSNQQCDEVESKCPNF